VWYNGFKIRKGGNDMPKIKCDWMTCKWNSSNKPSVAGYCLAEEVELTHWENEDDESVEEKLECETFEYYKEV
jgi:hypothetical protein